MRDDPLVEAASRVADGSFVDWPSMTATFSSDEDRKLAGELAVLAKIADAHRQFHLRPPQTLLSPTLTHWGHLELRGEVGRGSYGTVYRAWDPRLERLVALKLFHRVRDPESVMNEGRMLARIRHENVVTVHGADIVDGVAGIWMEYLEGQTLDSLIKQGGALEPGEAAAIGRDVSRALEAIHNANLLHCDVKAQNVVRGRDGRVVLMDFGAGRATPEGAEEDPPLDLAGTPRYMAPELFEHFAPPTRRSDVYSLGVLLYYLVTGKFPVDGASMVELKQAHKAGQIAPLGTVRPGLAAEYVNLIVRALSPDPADRPASALEMRRALEAIVTPPAARRPWRAVAAGLALATVATVATVILWPAEPTRIAVLPIRNLTGIESKAYLADGLTEVLISDVARVRSVRVPPYAAVASLRDSKELPAAIAQKLGVRYLVTGSLVEVGDKFRMAVQLIDARSGESIWGDELARAPEGMMSAQAEVARMVANKLALALGAEETRALTQAQAIDRQAQEAYLTGLALTRSGPARLAEVANEFRRAVNISPGFAAAWAQLALVEIGLMEQVAPADRPARAALIRNMAERAISLDPSGALGHAALGTVQFYHLRDFDAADGTFRRALDVDPSNAFSRQRFSMFLAAMGRTKEAIDVGLEAERLEPQAPERAGSLGMLYYYGRDFARAHTQFERAISLAPKHAPPYIGQGRTFSAEGRFDEAIAAIQRAIALAPAPAYQAELARAYVAAGRRDDAAQVLAILRQRERAGETFSQDMLAFIAGAEGRLDDAFAILDQAIERKMLNVLWIKVDPRADPLRADPRFASVVSRLGLDR